MSRIGGYRQVRMSIVNLEIFSFGLDPVVRYRVYSLSYPRPIGADPRTLGRGAQRKRTSMEILRSLAMCSGHPIFTKSLCWPAQSYYFLDVPFAILSATFQPCSMFWMALQAHPSYPWTVSSTGIVLVER